MIGIYANGGLGRPHVRKDDLMRLIGDNRYLTGPYLAARERHVDVAVEVERAQLLKAAGITGKSGLSFIGRLRRSIGGSLVRLGTQLQGNRTVVAASNT